MGFPLFISFTLTNACNLRCSMCGQWSDSGYVRNKIVDVNPGLNVDDWKSLVDEISGHKIRFILIRGGEPFLYPGIMDLLEYINGKGIFMSIDTNGTVINKYAAGLVKLGNMHITFSVDGPEHIHDEVRGMQGSFNKIKENIALFNKLENESSKKISKSICFTISKYSYKGLGEMPAVARDMGITSISIVPSYYFSAETGEKYESEFRDIFKSDTYSWRGFHQNGSGIDFNVFEKEYAKYISALDGIENYPFMPFGLDQYKMWFESTDTVVGSSECMNVEKLMDIQPNGDANFCIDFPDYSIGNVKEMSIEEIWNGEKANFFRKYRREKPLAVCYRCGAKYCSEIEE
ncbi:MAG: radical SAM protein [Melioribacteraceae bacterium]|nr:radical SAM protein [Melioribacteraceae bacterium]